MLTTETIFIASKLDSLLSGNITSEDITNAKKLTDTIEDLIKNIVLGKNKSSKIKQYNFDKIAEILNQDENFEDLMDKSTKLIKNTEAEFADLIPKVEEVKNILKGLLPFNEYSDVLGVHISEPSIREQLMFLRLFAAIDNPLSVFARIADNSFTRQELDIIQQVYPELYEGVSGMITTYLMDMASEGKDIVGYTRGIGIKRFFGEAVFKPIADEDQQAEQGKQQASKQMNTKNFEAGDRMTPERDRDNM